MITWLQTSFGKHHKLVLALLLGITIISFVFFGAWSGANPGRRGQNFLGVDLQSQRALEPYFDLALLTSGNAREISPENIKFFILFTRLADTAQIPEPTEAQLRKELVDSFGTSENAKQQLTQLTKALQDNQHLSQKTAEARVLLSISNLWRIRQVQDRLTGPGYTLPFEAALQWRAENTLWSIEAATLAGQSFAPKIDITDQTLQSFFEQHKEKFRFPPRITASYALFKPTAADSTTAAPSDVDLRKYAFENAQKIPGLDLTKLDEHLKTHKDALEKGWREEQARNHLAGRISTLLAEQLPFEDTPPTPEKISQALASNGVTTTPLPAFDQNSIPQTTPISASILGNVLRLSSDLWRSDVYPIDSGAVVFFHQKTEPSRIPELAEVREKVVAEYTEQEKNRLFSQHASAIGKQLREVVAAGKKFSEAALALGLTVKSYPTFKRVTLPADLQPIGGTLLRDLGETPVGGITPVLRSGPDAIYARLDKKEEPKLDVNSPEIQARIDENARFAAITTLQGNPYFGLSGLLPELLRISEAAAAAPLNN